VMEDPIIREAQQALNAGAQVAVADGLEAITESHRELLTLHELIPHRLFQILVGQNRGRSFSV